MMHREIILKAFEKGKKEKIEKGNNPSINQLAIYISEVVSEIIGYSFGDRTMRDYYTDALKGNEIEIRQLKVTNALCNYLGYEDYLHFIKENEEESDEENKVEELSFFEKTKIFIKKNKIYLIVGLLSVISFSIYQITTKQKCMVWQEDHYVEIACDLSRIQSGDFILYKEDRIIHFKQVFPDSSYTFFTPNGDVTIWYGKNKKGELEFFTDLGLHPETGKTLKPITQYMIDKYLKK